MTQIDAIDIGGTQARFATGGGLGPRLAGRLPKSGFRDRFIAKGRFEPRKDEMPVEIITCAQPGLSGAAAAFAAEHVE
jgi:glucokinase